MTECVTDFVFNKASGHSYKHGSFTKNGSGGACAGVSFDKASDLY